MPGMSAVTGGARRSITTLCEVVEHLETIERAPGSPGEAQAAAWLADRLEQAGADVVVEPASYRPGYAPLLASACAAGAALGIGALRRRGLRPLAAAGGLALAAAIVDDTSNGPRVLRRLVTRPKPTQNVVATVGPADAPHTLVVLAHHDAAPTGVIFDQRLQYAVADRFPGLIERSDTAPPMWALVIGGPALVGAGALTGRRGLTAAGAALSAAAAAALTDIARGQTVPGANDNLSACAALVAIAERLRDEPVPGLRVVLASCGAEEVCQGGIYSFLEDHRDELPRDRTTVLNLDTIGSPQLVMLEGEGIVVMEDYPDPGLRDRIADAAVRAGVSLRRGARATSSTDSVVLARAGYSIATLASFDHAKALSNYHQMTDTAANLDFETVADAVDVTVTLAGDLGQPG